MWEKISQVGMTDEMVVKYEWYDGEVSWSLIESGAMKAQNARYQLTDNGDGTVSIDVMGTEFPNPMVQASDGEWYVSLG